MELFFDLVYAFAFTQLSDTLSGHQSGRGTIETLVLFLAVWWAWNYTAWATNWIDPDRMPVALLMLVLMAISLVVSVAIPHAFGGRGCRSPLPTSACRCSARRSWCGRSGGRGWDACTVSGYRASADANRGLDPRRRPSCRADAAGG
jgi:hypothetical protein